MEQNKIITILAVIAIIILITIPTITKVSKSSKEKSYNVATKKIMESAEKCYYDKKCTNTTITIGELITKEYLTKTINPKTEDYFSDETYIVINSDTTSLIVK